MSRVHAFHRERVGDYLLPRTIEEFVTLAEEGSLFEAVTVGNEVAGVCYVAVNEEGDEYEFGGVFVREEYRGLGLAEALGTVAIAAEFAMGAPPEAARLIAHVHEENKKPRELLKRLGFELTGEKEEAPGNPPPSMKRNAKGKVIGEVFAFDFKGCAQHADWLESFSRVINGPRGSAVAQIEVPFFTENLAEALAALRNIASGYRSAPEEG